MNIITFIFMRIPRKIIQIIFSRIEYLYYRFFYRGLKLKSDFVTKRYVLFEGKPLEKTADHYVRVFPERVKIKIQEADLICDHYFDLLGSGSRKLSSGGNGYRPIEWHSDFKSGYRWEPTTFFRDILFGHEESTDIKMPWELSRFQHLNVIGQAYILTRDKKYSEEFCDQIKDWIAHNKVGFGVNWTCAMDVAIRAVNWLVAMEYFADEGSLSDGFKRQFYSSIYDHGKFIRGHLEHAGGWTTNHYLADIAGLFFISVFCPFFEESVEWRKFSLNELHEEIEKQVYSDGCSFESSTSYQRLALEMFFYAELLGRRAGIEFSEGYKHKLKKMFEASMYCMKPSGMIPQIGDNDSGRFLQFSKRAVLDHSYLLSIAAVYFKDNSFKLSQFGLDEEAFWLFGEKAVDTWNGLDFRDDYLESRSFPDAGWYVIRHQNDYSFISCGPNGGDGWHAHNDKLSFELVIDGQDVIVDPSTYVYTSYPAERNKFRSTGYHNTVMFNGYEQNDIPEKIMFSLPEKVRIRHAVLTEDDDRIVFQGEINYKDFTHRRMITLNKKKSDWEITDSFSCPKETNAKVLFHLSPDIGTDGKILFTKNKRNRIASIELEGHDLDKGHYDYSPEYGTRLKAQFLTAHIRMRTNNQTIITHVRSLI
jgi:hypothetical protein